MMRIFRILMPVSDIDRLDTEPRATALSSAAASDCSAWWRNLCLLPLSSGSRSARPE
jgi:hypothetical protein